MRCVPSESPIYKDESTNMPVNTALAEHYRQLLGLNTPWRITDIQMSIEQQRLDLTIEWPAGRKVRCPECGKSCAVKDHREERIWRHLDTMQFQTYLHCRVPRSECATHGARTIDIPWAEANSRWTLLYEAFALLVLTQVSALTKAAALLHISWDEAYAIRARAVRRGLNRRKLEEIEYIGMDEIALEA
jgi:transposase